MEKQLMHPNPTISNEDPAPIIPVVYEDEKYQWEYKYIQKNLNEGDPLSEKRLNELGKEGWELVSVCKQDLVTHFYFKRPVS